MKKKFHNRLQADGEKVKSLFGEFKKFIARGNVLDMAVGVIVGSAFTSVVNSLVNDIFMPPVTRPSRRRLMRARRRQCSNTAHFWRQF